MSYPNEKRPHFPLAEVKAAARGRWPAILAALGVDARYTDTRKHQPCPACGGKDRYRFTDHKQGGGFICNHCAPDDCGVRAWRPFPSESAMERGHEKFGAMHFLDRPHSHSYFLWLIEVVC